MHKVLVFQSVFLHSMKNEKSTNENLLLYSGSVFECQMKSLYIREDN